jgi:transposase
VQELLDKGMSCQSIAKALLLDGDTVRTWHQLYQEDRIECEIFDAARVWRPSLISRVAAE